MGREGVVERLGISEGWRGETRAGRRGWGNLEDKGGEVEERT